VDGAMWESVKAKVTSLATSIIEIKEILLMNMGGIGLGSRSKMFTATIVESSHTLSTSGTNSLKDMALTLMPRLVANMSPTHSSLMILYKGCCEYSCVEDRTNTITFEHPTNAFQDELNPSLKLVETTIFLEMSPMKVAILDAPFIVEVEPRMEMRIVSIK